MDSNEKSSDEPRPTYIYMYPSMATAFFPMAIDNWSYKCMLWNVSKNCTHKICGHSFTKVEKYGNKWWFSSLTQNDREKKNSWIQWRVFIAGLPLIFIYFYVYEKSNGCAMTTRGKRIIAISMSAFIHTHTHAVAYSLGSMTVFGQCTVCLYCITNIESLLQLYCIHVHN